MTSEELRKIIKCGETSLLQFKQEFTTQKEIAADMIAFADGRGGDIMTGAHAHYPQYFYKRKMPMTVANKRTMN